MQMIATPRSWIHTRLRLSTKGERGALASAEDAESVDLVGLSFGKWNETLLFRFRSSRSCRKLGAQESNHLSSPQSRLQLNRDISAGAVYRDSTKSVPTTRPVGRSKNRAPDVSPSVHRFSPMDPLLPFRHRVSSHRYTYRSIDRCESLRPISRCAAT